MRHWAEAVAKTYLEAQGYLVVAENYTVPGAEIDIIAERGDLTVVVEVKQRRQNRYGTPAEAITPRKQARLQEAALHYLAARHGRDDLPLRFDALLLSGGVHDYRLEHLEGIF